MTTHHSSDTQGMSSARLQNVRAWLAQQISSGRLAGASVLVARHAHEVLFDCAGFSDKDSQREFDRDSIVRIYSMTKPVTTVAAMMLYEQGHFHLDDPIARYLPEFADTPVWLGGTHSIDDTKPQKSPITVRQLMNHTSGLSYEFMQATPVDQYYRDHQSTFSKPVRHWRLLSNVWLKHRYCVSRERNGTTALPPMC